jgi:hypothetical protein
MASAFRAWHKTRNTHHKGRVEKEIEMGFEYVDFSTAILYLGTPVGFTLGVLIGLSISFNEPR